MIRAIIRSVAVALCLLLPGAAAAQQPASEYEGAAALGLELRRLGTVKRVLMIGAHPDDESTQILSALALGQGADVAYLSLTRGEGGQNGIGPELQEGLGLLRTEELLAARRLDGATQYFTRAYDFGFSKNAEEAFLHWPREELLRDVVAAIRHFRPQVVLSVFSGTPRDGHGQHQAAGILAREAFDLAGDPSAYPEQVTAGLPEFAPARLYLALWGGNEDADTRLETGSFDPLLGASHYQVAMASRSRHRSQDMGRPLTPGPQENGLQLVEAREGIQSSGASPFAGLDTTLVLAVRDAAGAKEEVVDLAREYDEQVQRIRESFNPLHPQSIVQPLAEALSSVRRVKNALVEGDARLAARDEAADAEAALWRAAGLELDALASDETIVPGQEFELRVTLWNGGVSPVSVQRLEPVLPEGWTASASDREVPSLAAGQMMETSFRVKVPANAPLSRPYFLEWPRDGDLYAWNASGGSVGVPFEPAPVHVAASVDVAGAPVTRETTASYLEVDRRQGEVRRPLRIAPAVSVRLAPGTAVVPLREGSPGERRPLQLVATLRSEAPAGVAGTLSLRSPGGWSVSPARVEIRFATPGEERSIPLTVTPPAGLTSTESRLEAVFTTAEGAEYSEGFTLVDYPHVRPRQLFADAVVDVHSFPVALPGDLKVAYIPGAGDGAPEALDQLGVQVTTIGPGELGSADLGGYDAVLTGIRAYEVNTDLIAHNRRLLEYARRGGTVVVQYNKYEYTEDGIAPYPVEMSRPHDRVTDETAEVKLLEPEHQALSWPNRITAADFEGWVQERGLYFLSEWGESFEPLLEMSDPGEAPLRGSLLVAPYGEGVYVYSGLAFFRQLPEGVPGAYRLLVNLLSLGKVP